MKKVLILCLIALSLSLFTNAQIFKGLTNKVKSEKVEQAPLPFTYIAMKQYQKKDPLIEFHTNGARVGFIFMSSVFATGLIIFIVNVIKITK